MLSLGSLHQDRQPPYDVNWFCKISHARLVTRSFQNLNKIFRFVIFSHIIKGLKYFNQIKVKLHHVSPLLVELLCNSPEMHAGSCST